MSSPKPFLTRLQELLFPIALPPGSGTPRAVVLSPMNYADVRHYLAPHRFDPATRTEEAAKGFQGLLYEQSSPTLDDDLGRFVQIWVHNDMRVNEAALFNEPLSLDYPPIWDGERDIVPFPQADKAEERAAWERRRKAKIPRDDAWAARSKAQADLITAETLYLESGGWQMHSVVRRGGETVYLTHPTLAMEYDWDEAVTWQKMRDREEL